MCARAQQKWRKKRCPEPYIPEEEKVSAALAEHLRQAGVADDRIEIIQNGIDPVRFHAGVDGRAVR